MRNLVLLTLLIALGQLMAQTGPGGVGTSTNNVLWLDANFGITQASGLVSQWNDRSGNANHALLPGTIPLATPTFVSSSVNGYPSLDFDGADDQLWVTDHASIDLTQWHFFIVVTADLQKDHNAWIVKGDDSDENYEMLSYSDGNIHTPTKYTDGTRTFPSSAGGQVSTTAFDVFEYSYSTGVGRDVYKNAANIITDNENKTPRVNNFPLYIANERSSTGRCVNGDIAEVVAFNAPLNGAQRIIVNNYLAAKYARTLSTNDIYVQDNAGNGNYDHDVAGIGRVNASNMQTDSRGSGIVQIGKAGYGGLDNNEFLLWGHDNAPNTTSGSTDYPASVQGRLRRVWRVSEVDASGSAVNVGNTDITWDLAGLGSVTATDLCLLVDTDNDGLFVDETPITGATSVGGTLYRFSNTNALVNNLRFTLGTSNLSSTPLPVELVSFDASATDNGTVELEWITATEQQSDHFTVERSGDLLNWTSVASVDAAGTSHAPIVYSATDTEPLPGVGYYRLRQTDVDGSSTLSAVIPVWMEEYRGAQPLVYPNPSQGSFAILLPGLPSGSLEITMTDPSGRLVDSHVAPSNTAATVLFEPRSVRPGAYNLRIVSEGAVSSQTVYINN